MSSLPARMRMIDLKMKELECSQDFSHYKFMGIFAGRSRAATVQPAKRLYPSRLRTWNFASHVTFLRGFCVEVAWVCVELARK